MTTILLALTLATHSPYHWTMTCARFHESSIEIMRDDNLDYRAKRQLIQYFRGKVEERCDSILI